MEHFDESTGQKDQIQSIQLIIAIAMTLFPRAKFASSLKFVLSVACRYALFKP